MQNKLTTLMLVLFLPIIGISQTSLQNTLRKFKNDQGVTSIKFNGNAFIENAKRPDNQPLKSKIDFIDFYIFEDGQKFSDSKVSMIEKSLEKDNFELLINAKNKEGHLTCHVLEVDGVLNQAYANINADGKSFYVVLSGEFYFDELALLNIDFDGNEMMKYFDF